MKKIRLDVVLSERNLVDSRESAQRYIRAGKVLIDEVVTDKPGIKIAADANIRILLPKTAFVSRGGDKLDGALETFHLNVNGLTAADLGASTGGFTDCLLQRGAKKVYAVDVGRGQLAYPLQTDSRVIVMDNTNCRYLDADALGEAVDLVVADLSFISLKTVFPAIESILKPSGFAVLLVKPQFEIGKGKVGKKGIVREKSDHVAVLMDCYRFFGEKTWSISQLAPSNIQGKTGNMEFLIHVSPQETKQSIVPDDIEAIVNKAHETYRKAT
ncbi:TlyA family rRNA (cytidine-2'-O)-methyltransferase [bacterium]|nr:TlyA family rRNA (cytidine-2'-O)-methyltransferase [bacterium]